MFRRGHRSEAPRLVDPTHPIYGDPLAWEALGGKASGSARFARSYRYDQAGQLSEIRDSRRGALQYRYDAIGRLLGALHPNGLQETFAFDPAHNLLDPMGGQGLSLDNGKKPANLSQDTETDFKEKIRKLLEDPEWNPLTHPIEATPTTSPGGGPRDNRLRVFEDKRFDYDVYGNLTEKRIGRHTVMRFEYDGDHQMIAAHVTRHGLTQTTRYGYDPFGRRVSKRDAFGITRFNWDGNRLLSESRGAHSRLFIYEPDSFVPMAQIEVLNTASTLEMAEDEELETPVLPTNPAERIAALQAMALQAQMPKAVQPSGSVQIRYYHCDHLGTPRELSDQQGRLVWAAEYKAWGNTVRVEYPDVVDKAEQEGIQQPLRFQGQYYDSETGFHYNRFRYYDPDTGRFVNHDLIGLAGGSNLYFYAPNPISWIDPLGLARTGHTPRTPFSGSCPDDVARQVLSIANKKSLAKNKEYGGLIYKKGGKYFATIPIPGTERSFKPGLALPQVPKGAVIVGDYHTHGDYSLKKPNGDIVRTSNPAQDVFKSEEFSDADERFSQLMAKAHTPCHRSYLATPSGKFKVYIPKTWEKREL
ncbi:RHS repeat-associated core domain-containing protein [Chitinimonas lacunae]|uniref:RHS repeat-associated core domain-containing protein n=1 Tax=Chitinimonas lacunae TaxID=1963018 RepID=A0ABV8MP96_9NEIS